MAERLDVSVRGCGQGRRMLCGAILRELSHHGLSARYVHRRHRVSIALLRRVMHYRYWSQHSDQSGFPLRHAFIGHYVSLKRCPDRVSADLRVCPAQR